MKKLILTVASIATVAAVATSFSASEADARGFGRGFNTTAIVLNEAYWAKVRAERTSNARAHRSAAATRARAVAHARAEARAHAVAAAKTKAAGQAQARLAAQKAEIARLRAQNEKLQQAASAPAARPIQTAQNEPIVSAPIVRPVEAKQLVTGDCKRFIPTAGITVSVPCS